MTNAQDRGSRDPAEPVTDLDPYFDWALGIGKPNFFLPGRQQVWMPVLGTAADRHDAGGQAEPNAARMGELLRVPRYARKEVRAMMVRRANAIRPAEPAL